MDLVARGNAIAIAIHWWRHTVVDLLQRHDRVCRQALLRILIQQEGLGGNWALLRRQHLLLLRVEIHGRHGGRVEVR